MNVGFSCSGDAGLLAKGLSNFLGIGFGLTYPSSLTGYCVKNGLTNFLGTTFSSTLGGCSIGVTTGCGGATGVIIIFLGRGTGY